jgi:hypothetical protein
MASETPEIRFALPKVRPPGLKNCTEEQMKDVYKLQEEISKYEPAKIFNKDQLSLFEAYSKSITYSIPGYMDASLKQVGQGSLKDLSIASYCKDPKGEAIDPEVAVNRIKKGVNGIFHALETDNLKEKMEVFKKWINDETPGMNDQATALMKGITNLLDKCCEFHDIVGGVQHTDEILGGVIGSIKNYKKFEKLIKLPPLKPVFDLDCNPYLHTTSKGRGEHMQKINELRELLEKIKAENDKPTPERVVGSEDKRTLEDDKEKPKENSKPEGKRRKVTPAGKDNENVDNPPPSKPNDKVRVPKNPEEASDKNAKKATDQGASDESGGYGPPPFSFK